MIKCSNAVSCWCREYYVARGYNDHTNQTYDSFVRPPGETAPSTPSRLFVSHRASLSSSGAMRSLL